MYGAQMYVRFEGNWFHAPDIGKCILFDAIK
jgi:hypothetical protein